MVLENKDDTLRYIAGYPNFQAITKWNNSNRYAMAVTELAARSIHREITTWGGDYLPAGQIVLTGNPSATMLVRLEELFAFNDVELFDLEADPHEMQNLAQEQRANGDLLLEMNDNLNALIEDEVGEDFGQMLPGDDPVRWRLDPTIHKIRM